MHYAVASFISHTDHMAEHEPVDKLRLRSCSQSAIYCLLIAFPHKDFLRKLQAVGTTRHALLLFRALATFAATSSTAILVLLSWTVLHPLVGTSTARQLRLGISTAMLVLLAQESIVATCAKVMSGMGVANAAKSTAVGSDCIVATCGRSVGWTGALGEHCSGSASLAVISARLGITSILLFLHLLLLMRRLHSLQMAVHVCHFQGLLGGMHTEHFFHLHRLHSLRGAQRAWFLLGVCKMPDHTASFLTQQAHIGAEEPEQCPSCCFSCTQLCPMSRSRHVKAKPMQPEWPSKLEGQ